MEKKSYSYTEAMGLIRGKIKSLHIKYPDFTHIDEQSDLSADKKERRKQSALALYHSRIDCLKMLPKFFVLMGDLKRIDSEIIIPIETTIKEGKEGLDLEFKRLTVEELLSLSINISLPKGKDGGVLIIEGIERLDKKMDYSGNFSRLVMPSIKNPLSDINIRWTVIFTTKEYEDRNTLGWLKKKEELFICPLKD